ncbi:MAG: hypothetical protein MRK01_02265 [Candidatus Scalindua sp.]|nr:hypothetical protein [Candidatus Scalindua sp.]
MLRVLMTSMAVFVLSSFSMSNHVLGSYNVPDTQQLPGQSQRVEIYDHGLQVPVNSFELPPGWHVNQHIATDLNDVWRMYSSYVLDLFGPNGEIITNLFPVAVYPSQGQNWEQVWLQLFHERVGHLGTFQFSPTIQSPLAQTLFPKASQAGIRVLEKNISGTLQGRQVEGKLFTLMADTGYSLIMYPSAFLCPKGLLSQTIETMRQIDVSQIQNPQYQVRSRQLMAERYQQHQILMRSSQNWFESHMASMRQASRMQSQSNQEFSAYLKSGGSTSAHDNNTFTPNDQFTEYLRDNTTFDDPYSGHRISQPGQYEYWYTDRLGNYHGTNDPNFDPNSLVGNWYGITPLGH